MAMRIYVDFNTMTTDPKERVYINTHIQSDLVNSGFTNSRSFREL